MKKTSNIEVVKIQIILQVTHHVSLDKINDNSEVRITKDALYHEELHRLV